MVFDDSGVPPRQDIPRSLFSGASPVPPPTPGHFHCVEAAVKKLRKPTPERVLATANAYAQDRGLQIPVSAGMVEYVLQVLNPPHP
ncbi:hypothetical protein ACTOB_005103 [Actinoplanes oblitus]|uniref:Uncharacterized protein n=1 Tax=Actinoplanes oblitus TaxID=3040509 RepID=A0ABY8W7M2_9ACTN|nr:hypothetical protein [Actinoplanes oblitus]WIM93136.1 hypothetical protein ACTOB_005103 [Actinoplanes oblitus]